MGKFPDIRVQPAECVYGRCDQVPSVLEAVEFAGIVKTKRDALLKEIGPCRERLKIIIIFNQLYLIN